MYISQSPCLTNRKILIKYGEKKKPFLCFFSLLFCPCSRFRSAYFIGRGKVEGQNDSSRPSVRLSLKVYKLLTSCMVMLTGTVRQPPSRLTVITSSSSAISSWWAECTPVSGDNTNYTRNIFHSN